MGAPGNDQPRFTPGPWRAVIRANQAGVRSVAIDMPKGSRSYEKSGAFGRTVYDEQDRANAHLISAAPDMYEALVDARRSLRNWLLAAEFSDEAIANGLAKIDAALAKARVA